MISIKALRICTRFLTRDPPEINGFLVYIQIQSPSPIVSSHLRTLETALSSPSELETFLSLKPPIKELTLHTSISGSYLEAYGEIFTPPRLLESCHGPLELFRHFVTPSGSHSPRNRLIHACLFEIDDHSIHLRKHLSSFGSRGTCRWPSVLRLLRFVVVISPQIFSTQSFHNSFT